MTVMLTRILIAGVLFVHGLGHSLGYFQKPQFLPFFKLDSKLMKYFIIIFWTLVAVGFLVSCLSFLGWIFPPDIWRNWAVGSAVLSLVGLLLFGWSWPGFNLVSAFLMNVLILYLLLWLNWPPHKMFGR